MTILNAENISRSFGDLQVLKNVSITIESKEIVSIVGASGAGKSTLLHILGTLDRPNSGSIQISNNAILDLKKRELAAFRNKNLGFVFQFHNLLPEFTALENVCLPGYIGGNTRNEVNGKGKALLKLLGLGKRMEHKPGELSGGEQQRVSVARALINQPSIIFADEPSGNLDTKNAEELHQLFFKLREETGQTFVIVTHNNILADMSDRKLEMRDGKMV